MRFAYTVKDVHNRLRHFKAVCVARINHHPDPAERLDGAFERLVGLNADNLFLILIQIAGLMEVMVDGVWTSTSRTPPFSLSFLVKSDTISHSALVLSVGPAKIHQSHNRE